MKAETAVSTMSDFVNNFNSDHKEFCELMSRDHRTLQQSFTRLCLEWLEHVASDNYSTDLRNESSHTVARDMIKLYQEKQKEIFGRAFLPSESLPFV